MLFMLMSKGEGAWGEAAAGQWGKLLVGSHWRMQEMSWDTGSDSGLVGLLVNLA